VKPPLLPPSLTADRVTVMSPTLGMASSISSMDEPSPPLSATLAKALRRIAPDVKTSWRLMTEWPVVSSETAK